MELAVTIFALIKIKLERILISSTISFNSLRSLGYYSYCPLYFNINIRRWKVGNQIIINTFVLLKRLFYILTFIAGFSFSSNAQVKSTFADKDAVKTVKFYPNPAVSFINFEFDKSYDKTYTLYIFNFIGKKVVELKITDKKITVPLTDIYRGVYVFQLRNAKGTIVESGKFQVAK